MHKYLTPKTKKMKRSLFVIGFVLYCIPLYSWDLLGNAGARGSSMGGCSVALCDFWSVQNNPAGIARWQSSSAGISYENRFLMKELSYYNAAAVLPLNIGSFGLTFSRFGFEGYNENKIGIAYARQLGPHIRIGLQLDYLSFKFSGDYAKRRTATFELGLQSDITEKLTIGVFVFNPINIKLKTIHKQKIPIVLKFGLSYKITDDFSASTEIEYNSDKDFDYRFGLEYLATRDFFIRAGVHTKPATASIGVGYSIRRFIIDIAASMNQHTGVSFQTSLIFNIKEI